MTCPDCCFFHECLRWIGNAFTTGELYLGLGLGIVFIFLLAVLFDA